MMMPILRDRSMFSGNGSVSAASCCVVGPGDHYAVQPPPILDQLVAIMIHPSSFYGS